MSHTITVRAFAKINLDLQVIGVRPDGYHELRTTFQSIALSDTLTFTKTRGPFRIECDDGALPLDRTNLIWKAAERMMRLMRRRDSPSGVTVRVEKNIPMQSGLGGGSSDAAATLRALASLWRVRASDAELRHAAAKLGADVPYFLEGGTVLGFHRGDLLFPLDDIPRAWVVVVVPEFGVSTKEAFGWWDREGRPVVSAFGRTGSANDLQKVVSKHHPVVSRLVRALQKAGAFHASLSGSGSAVYGMFRRRADAQSVARMLAGPRTFVTPTLSRALCRKLAGK